ncbi:hypothetical protein [Nocardioides sp. cx-173]|uniref:hypothetical protein n=1 Tax=Nocardioides sp. cx-173 TaxID=2898796 RepID=UPI001E4FE3C0|nr:hypothetical protein [Nocardioides sp. cx-173]MCD4526280.1 hypothetical protein [Nocardioides sp. cx-173]UGB40512.1 hypothetical protein LQ940_14110 [Nocardioides sp. cx-173]
MHRRFAMLLVASLGGLLVLTGCSDLSAQLSGEQSSEPVNEAAAPPPPLVTESWGTVDGLLSVLVRNPSRRTLRYAAATVTARDASGVSVASSRGEAEPRDCCVVTDLPPGATFGLYVDVGTDVESVQDVEVAFRDVAWRAPSPTKPPPMEATAIRLAAGASGAVVLADVATPGGAVDEAVLQAHLVDAHGEFLAVVSGRWACFAAGGSRRIEMQLFHPVPPGTEVASVLAYPVLSPARPAPGCTG